MQRRPYRTALYVPADKPDWMAKAPKFGADAYILDLEDACADERKVESRAYVRKAIPGLAAAGVGVFVRVNAIGTPYWLEDLTSVVVPGLTGIVLPKPESAGDVLTVATVLDYVEAQAGIEPGETDIQLLLETAAGMQNAHALMTASPRVRSYFGGVARDADVARALGLRWTREGAESLFVRSKLLLDGRAAGIHYGLTGTWIDLDDLEGLQAYAIQGRNLGYSGMYVIHPSHVSIVNDVFTPTPEEIDRLRKIVAAMEEAERDGLGAVRFEGTMIDIAMVAGARNTLATVDALGL